MRFWNKLMALNLMLNVTSAGANQETCSLPLGCGAKIYSRDENPVAEPGKFETIFTDNSNGRNLRWSKLLPGPHPGVPGRYSNGCAAPGSTRHTRDSQDLPNYKNCSVIAGLDGREQVDVNDSEAEKACQKVGGRLPTIAELDGLLNNFDHTDGGSLGPWLTDGGWFGMEQLFGNNVEMYNFWTSSIAQDWYFSGKFYNENLAYYFRFDGRSRAAREDRIQVRCVSGR